jgi:hypothetical protein
LHLHVLPGPDRAVVEGEALDARIGERVELLGDGQPVAGAGDVDDWIIVQT